MKEFVRNCLFIDTSKPFMGGRGKEASEVFFFFTDFQSKDNLLEKRKREMNLMHFRSGQLSGQLVVRQYYYLYLLLLRVVVRSIIIIFKKTTILLLTTMSLRCTFIIVVLKIKK